MDNTLKIKKIKKIITKYHDKKRGGVTYHLLNKKTKNKLESCASNIQFYSSPNSNKIFLKTWYCNKPKLCPICADRHQYNKYKSLIHKINLINDVEYNVYHFVFKKKTVPI